MNIRARIVTLCCLLAWVGLASPALAQGLPQVCSEASNTMQTAAPWQKKVELWTRCLETGQLKGDNLSIALNNRCWAHGELGQYKQALKDCDQALVLNPNYALALNNRGKIFRNLDQEQRAIEDFNQAISLKPDFAGAYVNRGTAYLALGQFQRAYDDYNQAIKLQPENALAFAGRAFANQGLGRTGQAKADARRANALDAKAKTPSF